MVSPPALRLSFALLALSAIVDCAVLGVWLHAHAVRNLAQAALEAAARRAGAEVKAHQLALELAPRLARLEADGAFQQPSRIEWANVLEVAAGSVPLPGLQWRMAPRLPMKGFEQLGSVTRVSLELALLHEADLLRFQTWLEQQAPGPWQFETCDLRASPAIVDPEIPAATAKITARCEFSAYVFKGRGT